ncbi:MAG: iron-sulfur cluster assembly scaffold protein [Erythrobacter sp.]|uniref:iron-sulfur cluster assembly scaffold protein n=1 Tax=Erythrobacter sp. TaxID=1042 RepID=UPI002630D726|nr:iron-sulfur cluster assembly scaffold protein [Erythrobacter sp.]MDJ0977723.1 iron-sulfur cluster assembly scaffold protein [Erythrobacter sp.]
MSALYTPEMLALSTELVNYPLTKDFACHAEARSKVCGSRIALGLDLTDAGAVSDLGMKVSACAIGQSSAAILASAAKGASPGDIHATLDAIDRWLEGEGDIPAWPRFGAIERALDHPGRHGALRLPWEAAVKALSSAE